MLIPSLEEGYGLPAIEAEYFGAPLVTSCDAALVEVSSASALHIDATDDDAWATRDPRRGEVRSRPNGPHAASTWAEIAALTAEVYTLAARGD